MNITIMKTTISYFSYEDNQTNNKINNPHQTYQNDWSLKLLWKQAQIFPNKINNAHTVTYYSLYSNRKLEHMVSGKLTGCSWHKTHQM